MAYTKAASSDTDASTQMRAYGTISGPRAIDPLTAEVSLPGRLRPGRSNLQFRSTNVPLPERTERDPDVAPARIARPSGQQGSTGNPIGNAIEKLGKTFRGRGRSLFEDSAVRQGFGELDTNILSAQIGPDSLGFGGGFSPEGAFGGAGFEFPSVGSGVGSIGGGFAGAIGGGFSAVPSVGGAILAGFNEGGFIRKKT